MSKRFIKRLVDEKVVWGWDDPRLSTLSGIRERGYTPEAIRDFCSRIGVAKADSEVDISILEHCVREDLNNRAQRAMVVTKPLKLIVDNYPEGKSEPVYIENNPQAETQACTQPLSAENCISNKTISRSILRPNISV